MADINNSLGQIGGGSFNQNNIDIIKYISIPPFHLASRDVIPSTINNLPQFSLNEFQSLWIIAITQPNEDYPVTSVTYKVLNKGKGLYGVGGQTLTTFDLLLVEISNPTTEDIIAFPSTDIIDFGDIGILSIYEYVNLLDPSITIQNQEDGYTIVNAVIDGVEVSYLFIGEGGVYGLSDLQSTEEDFQLLNNFITTGLQDLQSVLDTGNSAIGSIVLNDIDEINKSILRSYSLDINSEITNTRIKLDISSEANIELISSNLEFQSVITPNEITLTNTESSEDRTLVITSNYESSVLSENFSGLLFRDNADILKTILSAKNITGFDKELVFNFANTIQGEYTLPISVNNTLSDIVGNIDIDLDSVLSINNVSATGQIILGVDGGDGNTITQYGLNAVFGNDYTQVGFNGVSVAELSSGLVTLLSKNGISFGNQISGFSTTLSNANATKTGVNLVLPDPTIGNYILPLTVNGVSPDVAGNITISGGGAVASVNGQTGTVVLDARDIGSTPYGSISSTNTQAALDELTDELAAIVGVQDVKTARIANGIEVIKTGFEYGFDDFAGYTPFTTMTKTVGTTKGIKIVTAVDNFLPTGKIIDNNVYSVTVTAKCTAGATGYFGFGIKNGASWGGMQWRGSTGATALLQYNSSSFVGAASAGTQATFTTGDTISIQMFLRGQKSFLRFAKNGVWNTTEITTAATAPALSGGELVLAIRGASTWDDIVVKVEDVNEYSKEVYVSTTGSDTNNGTYDFPMATIQEAKYKAKGIGSVVLKAGNYLDQQFTTALGLNLKADTGTDVRLIYGTRFTSASILGGTTKVYSVAYAPTLDSSDVIWQHDVNDVNSLITQAESHPLHRGLTHRLSSSKSTWLASTAALEASSNSETHFFWNAGTLYFTIITGTNLIDNPIVVPDSGNEIQILIADQPNVTMNNINFLYRSVRLSSTKFIIENCSVLFSANSFGWQYGNSLGGRFIKCRAGGVNYNLGIGGDGFNGTGTIRSNVTFEDCWAHDNEDDGDSLHSYCESSIHGGLYEYNGGGVVAASGGHISIYNAVLRNSGAGVSAQGATADTGNSTNILASGCLMQNNTTNSSASSAWIRTTLINCIAKGNDFPAGADKWNCIHIP